MNIVGTINHLIAGLKAANTTSLIRYRANVKADLHGIPFTVHTRSQLADIC